MGDDIRDFLSGRGPAPDRPLQGLTILLVEDSRFASEAMRLMCQRSGARLRRADCLRSAERHLQTYRPSAVIVDMGLPDGSGAGLIARLAGGQPRVPVILGTSGDADTRSAALTAGADGFLEKPIESLVAFQAAVLGAMPGRLVVVPRPESQPMPQPDPVAFRDDLTHAADLLDQARDDGALDYVAQFLTGVAEVAHDPALSAAARAVTRDHGAAVAELSGLVQVRLAGEAAF